MFHCQADKAENLNQTDITFLIFEKTYYFRRNTASSKLIGSFKTATIHKSKVKRVNNKTIQHYADATDLFNLVQQHKQRENQKPLSSSTFRSHWTTIRRWQKKNFHEIWIIWNASISERIQITSCSQKLWVPTKKR